MTKNETTRDSAGEMCPPIQSSLDPSTSPYLGRMHTRHDPEGPSHHPSCSQSRSRRMRGQQSPPYYSIVPDEDDCTFVGPQTTVSGGIITRTAMPCLLFEGRNGQDGNVLLRSRLAIDTIVNKQRIVEEAASQGYDATVVTRVIAIMTNRAELTERNQGRLFKRIR